MMYRFTVGLLITTALVAGCTPDAPDVMRDDPVDIAPTTFVILPVDSINRGDERIELPDGQTYVPITVLGSGMSILEGAGTSVTGIGQMAGASTSRLYIHGIRDNATGAIVVTDTRAFVIDTDGPSFSGSSMYFGTTDVDSPIGSFGYSAQGMGSAVNYDYARLFYWSADDSDGNSFVGQTISGISTDSSEVPSSGSATFSGNALNVILTNSGESYRRGPSTVDVNFGSGLVDVSNSSGGDSRFDSVDATGMEISGNHFSGGSVVLMKNGSDITEAVTGGALGTDAAGFFFGPGTSLEIGGVVTVGGTDIAVTSFFLAD